MQFFQRWKSSLKSFWGVQLKEYLFDVVKSTGTAYKNFFLYGFTFVVINILILFFIAMSPLAKLLDRVYAPLIIFVAFILGLFILSFFLVVHPFFIAKSPWAKLLNQVYSPRIPFSYIIFVALILGLFILSFFLAVHPSKKPKDFFYFFRRWHYVLYVSVYIAISFKVLHFVFRYLFLILIKTFGVSLAGLLGRHIYSLLPVFLTLVSISFFIPFLLDTKGSLSEAFIAFWQSLKKMLYNFPGVLLNLFFALIVAAAIGWGVVFLSSYLIVWPEDHLTGGILSELVFDSFAVLLISGPVLASIITNYYVRRLRD